MKMLGCYMLASYCWVLTSSNNGLHVLFSMPRRCSHSPASAIGLMPPPVVLALLSSEPRFRDFFFSFVRNLPWVLWDCGIDPPTMPNDCTTSGGCLVSSHGMLGSSSSKSHADGAAFKWLPNFRSEKLSARSSSEM